MANRTYTAEQAMEILERAGFTPDEDFPGAARRPWRATCNTCHVPRRIYLTALVSGRVGCKHERGEHLSSERIEQALSDVAKRYEQGATIGELAKESGVSYGSVHRYLRNAGVQMRPPGARKRSEAQRRLSRRPQVWKR